MGFRLRIICTAAVVTIAASAARFAEGNSAAGAESIFDPCTPALSETEIGILAEGKCALLNDDAKLRAFLGDGSEKGSRLLEANAHRLAAFQLGCLEPIQQFEKMKPQLCALERNAAAKIAAGVSARQEAQSADPNLAYDKVKGELLESAAHSQALSAAYMGARDQFVNRELDSRERALKSIAALHAILAGKEPPSATIRGAARKQKVEQHTAACREEIEKQMAALIATKDALLAARKSALFQQGEALAEFAQSLCDRSQGGASEFTHGIQQGQDCEQQVADLLGQSQPKAQAYKLGAPDSATLAADRAPASTAPAAGPDAANAGAKVSRDEHEGDDPKAAGDFSAGEISDFLGSEKKPENAPK